MRRWTIEVTERELRAILTAFDIARDEGINPRSSWWWTTKYVAALYQRLCDHGLQAGRAA